MKTKTQNSRKCFEKSDTDAFVLVEDIVFKDRVKETCFPLYRDDNESYRFSFDIEV